MEQTQNFRYFGLCAVRQFFFGRIIAHTNGLHDGLYYFAHVDELKLSIYFNFGRFVVRYLVAKSGHYRIIKGMPKWPVHIGDDKPVKVPPDLLAQAAKAKRPSFFDLP